MTEAESVVRFPRQPANDLPDAGLEQDRIGISKQDVVEVLDVNETYFMHVGIPLQKYGMVRRMARWIGW